MDENFMDEELIIGKIKEIVNKYKSDLLCEIRTEINKLNPVDYGSIYSYESHDGAREMKEDILDIIDAFEESEE